MGDRSPDSPHNPDPPQENSQIGLHKAIRAIVAFTASAQESHSYLHEACRALCERAGFDQAWVILHHPSKGFQSAAATGVTDAFERMRIELDAGRPPACLHQCMQAREAIRFPSSSAECRECPVSAAHDEGTVWTTPLRFGEKVHGVLFVLQRDDTLPLDDGPALLLDASVAIASGLHRLEQESARLEAERRFQNLVDNIQGMVYQCVDDSHWSATYLSAGALPLTGYTPEQILAGAPTLAGLVHPDDREAVNAAVQAAIARGEPYEVRFRILHADGSVRHVIERGRVVAEDGPQGNRLEGLLTDITAQVRQEEQLRASEAKFRHIFEGSAVSKCIILPDGRLSEVNAPLCDLLGYSRDELASLQFADITHPDDRAISQQLSHELLTTTRDDARLEKRYLHKSGRVIWADVTATLLRNEHGDPLYFIMAILDITARKAIEEALRAKTEELEHFLEVALDLFCITDDAGRVLKLNHRWQEVLGYPIEQLQGALLLDFVHPDDLQATVDTMKTAAEGQPVRDFVNRYICADGAIKFIEWQAHPHGDINFAAARDITDRMHYEASLRRSEERFRLLIEAAPEPAFVQFNGIFDYLNAAARKLLGVEAGSTLVGTPVLERFHPESCDRVGKRFRDLSTHRETAPLVEERIVRLDGAVVPVEVSAVAFAMDGTDGTLVFLHDLSARKRVEEKQRELESQLQQAQKMESIGRLAGGIAHDFNNLLTPILGHTELIAEDLPRNHPVRESLSEIIASAERARDIATQLLSFSRNKPLDRIPLDLNPIVRNFQRMMGNLLGEDIAVILDLAVDPMPILGDVTQLEQILLNFAVNARDAMPHGGRFRLETRVVDIGDAYIAERPAVPPGDYAMLAVSDNGVGMDEATRLRIFDPFFTTKELDKGTGLGLSNVYGIVKQHDGFIWVYSEVGHGTTFKVYIPLVNMEPINYPAAVEDASDPDAESSGSARVLVLEDLAAVRLLVVKMLERLGHQPIQAETLAEARAKAAESEPIDLMISDVILPDGKGPEAYKELRLQHPAMRVIYMSGYTEHVVVDPDGEGVRFLQKPFTAKRLRAAVNEVLTEPSPGEEPSGK